jgi:hypothetical protein
LEAELSQSDKNDTRGRDNSRNRKPSRQQRKDLGERDIFISYAHKDRERVHAVCHHLRDQHGIQAWLDEWSILPGERIARSIEDGLKGAKIAFVMVSPSALSSRWVDLEWRTKFEEEIESGLVAVVCVLIEPIDPVTLPPYLKGKKHIAFVDNPASLADKIAETAKAHLDRREELNNKAISTGTVDLLQRSVGYAGGGALKPLYERVGTASVFATSDYPLRFRVLESDVEASLVVCQRKAISAKTHMDKMHEQFEQDASPIPLFIATAAAMQQEATVQLLEGLLVRLRNYRCIIDDQPRAAIELWNDVLNLLKTEIQNAEHEE